MSSIMQYGKKIIARFTSPGAIRKNDIARYEVVLLVHARCKGE